MTSENAPSLSGRPTADGASPAERGSFLEVLAVATRLGLTSFGGPVVHIGYFREEYVARRRWIDDESYADLVALCQFLPGPASSKVGIALGILRAGLPGGLAAWIGFTLPSALLLIAFAYGVTALDTSGAGWLHGLKVAAVAAVALAVWGMARSLCPDRARATLAVLAALIALAWPGTPGQVLPILVAGLIGWRFLTPPSAPPPLAPVFPVGPRLGTACWVLLLAGLVVLPALALLTNDHGVATFASFFRSGSLVFGGGHVVLPLLQAEVVDAGWVSQEAFVAGYGAAQAVPGPLFTFAAYLGAAMEPQPNGVAGGLIALAGIFTPAFLITVGALPFWDRLRAQVQFRAALRGVNAAVVGLLLAALYHPVWTSSIHAPADFALALAAFLLLAFWKWPIWLVVGLAAVAGHLLSMARTFV